MLVRRVLRHWHTQNWAGVTLDLLVVIAGILIGLRIDAWRDEVQDREDEQQYLERLLTDAETNHDNIAGVIERMSYRREQGRGALRRLLAGEAMSPAEQGRVMNALAKAGELPKPGIVTGTYDELISTGRMPIIEDQRLRTLLQRQIALHDQVAARTESYRQGNMAAAATSDRYAILAGVTLADGSTKLEKRFDLEGLRADSQAHVTFFNEIEASEDFTAEREAELLAVQAVRDHLRCALARPNCIDRHSSLQRLQSERTPGPSAE
jgi:hypothetical protein